MNRGYIKLWRKSLDAGWLRDHKLWSFWSYCLLKATHKEYDFIVGLQKVHLEPGQFVFGLHKAARDLNMTVAQIRSRRDSLKKAGNITIKSTNKYSIITIVNWDSYQGVNEQDRKQARKPLASKSQHTRINKHKNKYTASGDAVGEGDGISFLTTKKGRKLNGARYRYFRAFWDAFDYKKGKREAADAWYDIPNLNDTLFERIILAAKTEAKKRPDFMSKGKTPKMAQGWISGRRWEDEPYKPAQQSSHYQPKELPDV
jgi:hypothetical protein